MRCRCCWWILGDTSVSPNPQPTVFRKIFLTYTAAELAYQGCCGWGCWLAGLACAYELSHGVYVMLLGKRSPQLGGENASWAHLLLVKHL